MTRRSAALHPVALVSRWHGFCLPCGSDERPLALTWTGRRGVAAWLAGEGWHDGELRLTCACCGGVDVVGWEDEPEPEAVPVLAVPVLAVPAVAVPVQAVAAVQLPVVVPVQPRPVDAPAAQVAPVVRVVDVHGGAVPTSFAGLRALPGGAVEGRQDTPQRRAERRATERAARRAAAPHGASDDDALDVLHLVG